MRFRKLAGSTAGALVLGALSVPMLATPAQAAPVSATTPFSATCTYATFNLPVTGNLTVKVDKTDVTATLEATASLGTPAITTSNFGMELTLDIDGAQAVVSGSKAYSPANPGMTPMPIPEMKGTRASSADPVKFDVTAAKLALSITYGKADAPCTFTDIAPVSFPAPPKALAFSCNTFGMTYDYATDLRLTAQAKADGKVAVTAAMDAMPNPAPPAIALPNQTFQGTLGTDLGNLTGSHQADFKGGTAIVMPALAGSMAASGSTMTVTVKDFSLAVPSADMTIPCKLAAPKAFTVDITPLSKVCSDAIAGLPGAQAVLANATNAANAEAGKIAPANAAVAAATKAVKKADSSVKKANKAVKKANKAVKKAKAKAKKAKAKKNVTKKKKAVTKAKKAQKKAKSQLAAAKARLAAAKASSAAANAKVSTGTAAVSALQNTIKNC